MHLSVARGFVRRALFCLKQDGQDAQDEQDYRPSPRSNRSPPKTRHQVREALNVYRLKQSHDAKVREDLNRYRLKQDGQDEQDAQDEGTIAGVCPLRNRSGAVTNRAYRQRTREPPCRWRSPDRHRAGSGDPALRRWDAQSPEHKRGKNRRIATSCSLRSPDRKRGKIRRSCPTEGQG